VKPPIAVIADINVVVNSVKNSTILTVGHYVNSPIGPSKVARYAFAVGVFLLASVSTTAQTSIAVFRNSTEIIAGSDSKQGLFNSGGSAVVCKVNRLGYLFWSVAGLSGDFISNIVATASAHSMSIRHTAEVFASIAPEAFQEALGRLRLSSPNDYATFMIHDHGKIDIIFFGMEGKEKIPVVIRLPFVASEIFRQIILVTASPIEAEEAPACMNNATACGFAVGYNRAIASYTVHNPGWGRDLVGDVKRFVQLEIDEVPDNVGPPIRILIIDGKGPHWIQNGEGCDIGVPNKEN
jgi:hypothetical protein